MKIDDGIYFVARYLLEPVDVKFYRYHEWERGRQSLKKQDVRKEMRWGKLDNTANLFPVIANETMTNVYRMSITLTEEIDSDCLQQALEMVLPSKAWESLAFKKCYLW